EAIWKDEKTSNSHTKKYKYRWDADLVCDNLNIGLNTISQIDPFKKTENAKNASFGILVGGNNPKSITKPIYKPFRDYLLDKCNQNKVVLKAENDKWSFDINTSVKEILLPDDKDELAIKEELVVRILNHLKSEKHVILVGPPGVGKTDLARRILRIIGKKVINDENFLRSVASDEWSRFEVIGGINLQNKFQEGWITKAVLDKKWLLIDEFNRANMNKAFGEMFLGIEYSRIDFRPSEKEVLGNDYIEIDKDFRMICTMNDFDKNLLLSELSYGLISRFAFVSITPDITKEPKIIQRKMETLYKDISYEDYTDQIKTYFNFINKVREQRNIGVRTSIDVIKYLITSSKNNSAKQTQWILLNDALCDYVLPQFDRLDGKTINHVLAGANQYLQNNAFDNFKKELDKILDNLQKAAGWLDKNAY
ncbi:MAG TPA: AAA family ATPase, partial [Nitrososphaeraceae archaeon]|nr:AAA family ATPase [Nitrososphaeraceae archaeon]